MQTSARSYEYPNVTLLPSESARSLAATKCYTKQVGSNEHDNHMINAIFIILYKYMVGETLMFP